MSPHIAEANSISRARHGTRWALWGLVVVAGLAAPAPARAWGKMGHRAAAKMTEDRLTPSARAAVRDLLGSGESLANASIWADAQRKIYPESGPWHYVNVPITEKVYDDKFCGEKGCVVGKIGEFRRRLADSSAPRDERRDALRFLVHFVQDMHQPVHVGDRGDRGGNDLQVQFFGEGSNLHRVWDSGLVENAYAQEEDLLRALKAAAQAPEAATWARGTVVDWANESLDAARGAYRDPVTGKDLLKGAKLAEGYQTMNLPVARDRLARAGARLAAILNECLDPR